MASFVLPLPSLAPRFYGLKEMPADKLEAVQVLEIEAVRAAEQLLEAELATLDGEGDVAVGPVRLQLDLDLSGSLDGVARTWGRRIADAVKAALPHQQAKDLPGAARTMLGSLVPGGGSQRPTDADVFMFGWEMAPDDSAQRLVGYLQATNNPTLAGWAHQGASYKQRDLDHLKAFFGTGPDSFEAYVHGIYSQHRAAQWSQGSADRALGACQMIFVQMLHQASNYAVARVSKSQRLKDYIRDLWGTKAAGVEAQAFGRLPAFAFDRLGGLQSLIPSLGWTRLKPVPTIDTLALTAERLANNGDSDAAIRLLEQENEIDRGRILLSWREIRNGQWTAYEIRTNPVIEPTLHVGTVQADADILDKPKAVGAAVVKKVKKGESVIVAGMAAGWWKIDLDGTKSGGYGFLPGPSVNYGGHYQQVNNPLFVQGKGDAHAVSPSDVVQGYVGTCYFLVALTAVARANPDHIQHMIQDHGDGTVSVRFYRKEASGDFSEEWVRVQRSIPVTQAGHMLYARSTQKDAAKQLEMWPALLEKAYAAWKGGKTGGGYYAVHYGFTHEAMEEVLGRRAEMKTIAPGCNLPFADPASLTAVPNLDGSDRQRIIAYAATPAWQQEWQHMLTYRPGCLADLHYVLHHAQKAGVSEAGLQALAAHYGGMLEGKLGSRRYSQNAQTLFQSIEEGLQRGQLLSLATKKWGDGTPGRGKAGENVDDVPGLAGRHAYVVIEARTDKDGYKFIKLRNPHGHGGREYKKPWWLLEKVFGAGVKVKKVDDANFWIELSDVVRYFGSVTQTVV